MGCLFCSCYKKGRFPVLSLGPSWPFTIGLIAVAAIWGGFLGLMMFMLKNPVLFYAALTSILINLSLLFGGILGDPGVYS